MWTGIVTVVLGAVFLLLGPFTFLPSLIGSMVAGNIQENLGLAERPSVVLENEEAPLEMLLGEFTGGEVTLRDAEFGGVRTEEVVVDLDPFDVSVRESVGNGALVGDELRGDLRVEVSEEEVARLVESEAGLPVDGVDLSENEMRVDTNVALLGSEVPVTVRGGVGMEGEEIMFLPGSIAIAGTDLPQEAAAELLGELEVSFETGDFPGGAEIHDAGISEGRVVLTGRMEDL